MGNEQIDIYEVDEIARRRDEVVRRMANTPPQPRVAPKKRQTRKKKTSGADREPSRKGGDGRDES